MRRALGPAGNCWEWEKQHAKKQNPYTNKNHKTKHLLLSGCLRRGKESKLERGFFVGLLACFCSVERGKKSLAESSGKGPVKTIAERGPSELVVRAEDGRIRSGDAGARLLVKRTPRSVG